MEAETRFKYMNKINYNRLRKIHRVLLYFVFATVGYLFFAMLITAAELYEFPFRETETINVALILAAGIPLLILSAIIILMGHPAEDYILENPFISPQRLDAHYKVKLDERHFEDPIVLVDNPAMTITIRRKSNINQNKIFAFVHAPSLDSSSSPRMLEAITEYLAKTSDSADKGSLTVVISVEADSKEYPTIVRGFGLGLPIHAITVGFDFGQGKMFFHGKIDGLAAGKRKQMLKSFLSMMPEAQKYLDQEYLEGKERINRDKVVLPVNPKKIPRGIQFIWSLSSVGIALLSLFIGIILVSNKGILFAICAVLLFIYAFFMIGIGIYQLKKAFLWDDVKRHF
jgi:hypothetical protein